MKKGKRVISTLIVLIMCLSLLAACGSNNSEGNTDNNASPSSSDNSSSNNTSSSSSAPATSSAPSSSSPSQPQSDLTVLPPAEEDVKYADEIDVIVDNNAIVIIDPFIPAGNTPPTFWTFTMIYDTLVVRAGDGAYGPRLATSWETSDAQTYLFHLRDDVTFHNGEKFTADDIVFTIGKAVEAVGTTTNGIWSLIETVNVIDPYTIEFILNGVNVDFLDRLAQPIAGIVNEKAMNEDPDNGTWIGTGPWMVSEFATRDYTVLVRNDNYWGDLPLTKKLTLRYVPESSTKLMQLENGETDVCFSIDPADLPLVEADTDRFSTFRTVYNNCHNIGFNMDHPICGNYDFRMAVISAINREEVALAACGDYGVPETEGTFCGYATEFRNSSIPIVPYDLDAAKAYLEASPYNGETLEISCAIVENITAAEVIQQQLAKIGITTTINQMDPPALGAYTRYGESQAEIFVNIGGNTGSAASLRNIFYPGGSFNAASYNNPEVNDLLDLAATQFDVNARRDTYMRIQELIAQDPPRFTLFYLVCVVSAIKGVGGMKLANDTPFFDLTYIYKIVD